MKKYLPNKISQILFLSGFLVIILLNIRPLRKEIKRIDGFQKTMAHQVIGDDFFGLREFTKTIPVMGYFTDQNIKTNENAAKKFSHAQFVLAPTVLEKDNFEHEYILLVCENPKVAAAIIQKTGLKPIKANSSGMILAKHP